MLVPTPSLRAVKLDIPEFIAELKHLSSDEDLIKQLKYIFGEIPDPGHPTNPHIEVSMEKMFELKNKWFKFLMNLYQYSITISSNYYKAAYRVLIDKTGQHAIWFESYMITSTKEQMLLNSDELNNYIKIAYPLPVEVKKTAKSKTKVDKK